MSYQKHSQLSAYRNPGPYSANFRFSRRLFHFRRKKQCWLCWAQAATSQQDRQHVDDVTLEVLQRRIQLYALRNPQHIIDPFQSVNEKKKVVKQLEKQFAKQSLGNLDIQFSGQRDFQQIRIKQKKELTDDEIIDKIKFNVEKIQKDAKNKTVENKQGVKTSTKRNIFFESSSGKNLFDAQKRKTKSENGQKNKLNIKKVLKKQKDQNGFSSSNVNSVDIAIQKSPKGRKIGKKISVSNKSDLSLQRVDQIQSSKNNLQKMSQNNKPNKFSTTKQDFNSTDTFQQVKQQSQLQDYNKQAKKARNFSVQIEKEKTPQVKTVRINKAKPQIKLEKLVDNQVAKKQKKQVKSKNFNQVDKQKTTTSSKQKYKKKQVTVKSQKQDLQLSTQNLNGYSQILHNYSKVVVKSSKTRRGTKKSGTKRSQNLNKPNKLQFGNVSKLGQHAVLNKKSEFELTKNVYSYMKMCQTKDQFIDEMGREPNLLEWSNACGITDYRGFQNFVQDGQRAFNKLVRCNFRLVGYWAHKYQKQGMSVDDLICAGIWGLKRAAQKFNPHKGFRFGTYASNWIRQAINNAIMDESKVVRIPATYWDVLRKVKKIKVEFQKSHEREPTTEELAQGLKMDQERLELILARSKDPKSTHSLMGSANPHTFEEVTADFKECSDPATNIIGSCRNRDLDKALTLLDVRQSQAIVLRYGLQKRSQPYSLKQVAQAMKVSLETARKLIMKGLEELKRGEMWEVLEEYCQDQAQINNIPNRTGIRLS